MRYIDNFFLRLLLRPKVIQPLAHALLRHPVVFGDEQRVTIAPTAIVHNALLNVSSGNIEIGENVFFGHNVCLLTGTHDYRQIEGDRIKAIPPTGRDIQVGQGAWIASNVTIVGPARIGEHAVVGAGAVVLGDVAPFTLVAGVPARLLRHIDHKTVGGGEMAQGRQEHAQ